jgi:hypothetical protein
MTVSERAYELEPVESSIGQKTIPLRMVYLEFMAGLSNVYGTMHYTFP